MARQAVAIRHLHHEDAGLFEPVLAKQGYDLRYLDVWREPVPDAIDADLLIVLGGPIGVYDAPQFPFLDDEIALVRARIAANGPVIGICLGSQIMAAALGAPVYPGPAKELGWAPLTLTEAGARGVLAPLAEIDVLHWHGDTFDLPEGCERLASTPLYANQAFSRGPRTLALQFHAEVDAAIQDAWLIGSIGELTREAIEPNALRERARRAEGALRPAARAMLRTWLSQL